MKTKDFYKNNDDLKPNINMFLKPIFIYKLLNIKKDTSKTLMSFAFILIVKLIFTPISTK